MESKAKCLVKFRDTLEDNADEHFGVLFENGFIMCFCCGGYLESDDYEILASFDGFAYLDDTLKEYYE